LERLSWQVGLPSIELASFAGANDPLSVGYCGGPVEVLSHMVSIGAIVDVV
jgi:hypothetical protein